MCVCGRNELGSMYYAGISTYQFIPHYASAIHKHTHTRILKPFEDSEPTGVIVDTAELHIALSKRVSQFGPAVRLASLLNIL